MSAVLPSFVDPSHGYVQSLIQEALKPVFEELKRTQEEFKRTQVELKQAKEELRKTQEEMELWKTQCLDKAKNVVFQAPEFNQNVDFALLDSESKVLSRLQAVEIETGLKESAVEGTNKPTLSERVEKLEAHAFIEVTQKTKNEKRAEFFVKTIPQGKVTPSHDREIKSKEFREWIANLPEDLKAKSNTNLRKLKSDFFKLLEKLYPDKFLSLQDRHGNKEWKLIAKSVT
jgi:hypothetical protein